MKTTPPPEGLTMGAGELAARAAAVLRENDIGGWTRAAPDLYPHQWSWDSAFIAIGLAHLDTGRAAAEIRSLLGHQWKNGKVPHIVFNPGAPPESYFPGPEHWASAAPGAPDPASRPATTSGPASRRSTRSPRDASWRWRRAGTKGSSTRAGSCATSTRSSSPGTATCNLDRALGENS